MVGNEGETGAVIGGTEGMDRKARTRRPSRRGVPKLDGSGERGDRVFRDADGEALAAEWKVKLEELEKITGTNIYRRLFVCGKTCE